MMTGTMSADSESMRHAMVASQLRTNAVDDGRIVRAMAELPRERFLPAGAQAAAYRDTSIAVGAGRLVNPPLATARLLTLADLMPADRVLLIGAAGGYAAAVAAAIVAEVTAVEEETALAALAREALGGAANVTLVEGPLAAGSPGGAPYDVLVVDGAVEMLPESLTAQVREGGRIATGLVDRGVTRLASGRRSGGVVGLQTVADLECVVLPGFSVPRGFRF